jgi:hypothetical protein
MHLQYNTMYADHWQMLGKMAQTNYATEENNDDVLLLAAYVHRPVRDMKKSLSSYRKIIVYQTEPLVNNHWWKTEKIVDHIKDADEIWDYDYQNIQILRQHGINARFCPPTYTESLKTVKNVENPDIDILFYGTLNDYRFKQYRDLIYNSVITDEHAKTFVKTRFMFLHNYTDSLLDEYIGKSKIIWNMNPYSGETRQQQTRIFYALINNKCVISEKSPVNYYGNLIVEYENASDMFTKTMNLLKDDNWKKYTANNYKEQCIHMRKKVENILSYE